MRIKNGVLERGTDLKPHGLLGNQAALRLIVESGIMSVRTSSPGLDEVYVHVIGDRKLRV